MLISNGIYKELYLCVRFQIIIFIDLDKPTHRNAFQMMTLFDYTIFNNNKKKKKIKKKNITTIMDTWW